MNRYPLIIRRLHWLTVTLVTIQIMLGYLMESWPPLFYGHILTGTIIFILSLFRLAFRRQNTLPLKPEGLTERQWKMAKFGHILLYLALTSVPASGILAGIYKNLFGELHETLVLLFIILIVGHVFMVLKHLIFDKLNLLERMSL